MRRLLGALLIIGSLSSHLAYGCGDKLLVLGRPLYFTSRPAAILAYAPPGSSLQSLLSATQWTGAIAKGKHHLRIVQTPEQLAQVLKTERFDVILAGLAEAAALRRQTAATLYPAVVVPVVDSSSRDAFRSAQREYGVVMKGVAKSGDFVSAIGRAIELHDRRVEAAAREKKKQAKSS
jgi:hypothetical protein